MGLVLNAKCDAILMPTFAGTAAMYIFVANIATMFIFVFTVEYCHRCYKLEHYNCTIDRFLLMSKMISHIDWYFKEVLNRTHKGVESQNQQQSQVGIKVLGANSELSASSYKVPMEKAGTPHFLKCWYWSMHYRTGWLNWNLWKCANKKR